MRPPLLPAQGLGSDLWRRLSAAPRSPLAAAHLALALVLFPAAGFALFYAPKFALRHLLGYAYGASTFLLAKTAGTADKALIPATQLVLKVGPWLPTSRPPYRNLGCSPPSVMRSPLNRSTACFAARDARRQPPWQAAPCRLERAASIRGRAGALSRARTGCG